MAPCYARAAVPGSYDLAVATTLPRGADAAWDAGRLPDGHHWSAAGHRLVATELAAWQGAHPLAGSGPP